SAILELTATPIATKTNVLYHVSAQELAAESMIKLPIALAEHPQVRPVHEPDPQAAGRPERPPARPQAVPPAAAGRGDSSPARCPPSARASAWPPRGPRRATRSSRPLRGRPEGAPGRASAS
ncbi:MAG: hypothetical protein DYH06_13485, partial [Acidobacteria bacterium ACB2]|nr:hypothetical protein [Acidobacteria bacterium ACB2]